LNYTRSLNFEDKPSYSSIKSWLEKMVEKMGESYDPYFDWVSKKLGKKIPATAYAEGCAPKPKNGKEKEKKD
jgi:hypothetical protein